jgi:hypothetical protein
MLNAYSERINTDRLQLNVKLMPHQRAMIYQMLQIERNLFAKSTNTSYAMMSDKPGAGKTYVVLTMLYLTNKIMFKDRKPHVNLIVVPYNICSQWKQSIQTLYPESSIKWKCIIEYQDIMSLYVKPDILTEYDVLLTTSLYYNNIATTLKSLNLRVQRVFFDEADTIKDLLATPLDCNMTWFISASMRSLFTNASNVVNLGDYKLSLNHLLNHDVSCDPQFVDSSILLKDPQVYSIPCQNKCRDTLIEIHPQNAVAIQAMDFRPQPAAASYFDALKYAYTEATAQLQEARINLESLEKSIPQARNRYGHEPLVLQGHLAEINKRISECQTAIGHCESLIAIVDSKGPLYDQESWKPNDDKMVILQNVIQRISKENRQTIVFCTFGATYPRLRAFFDANAISYRNLDGGNIKTMDTVITGYKRKDFLVLLADSSMYSCGMNLENTDDIVFIHRMDLEREKQVIGRAQRLGRKNELRVWYVT